MNKGKGVRKSVEQVLGKGVWAKSTNRAKTSVY